MNRLARIVATGAGAGYLPVAPGTWGSLEAILIVLLLQLLFPLQAWLILIALTVSATLAGVWAATRLSRELGVEDPSQVVIDEVAGQWVTLLIAGLTPAALAGGFLLFRLFDIVKPFPVRQSESLPEGWGIVTDDVIAGAYAGLSLWLLSWVSTLV